MNKFDRSRPFVNLAGLIMLFIVLQVHAQSGGTPTTLEQVNQAVRETQKLCENQIEKGAVPGLAIAVVFQDKVVYAAGFGVRDVNTQEPVNADTVFQLASLSKPVGSTVVAELVGEGKDPFRSTSICIGKGAARCFSAVSPSIISQLSSLGGRARFSIIIRR